MKYLQTLLLLIFLIPTAQLQAKDLIVFGASWCGPCVQLKNFIKNNPKLVSEYDIQLLDIDKHTEMKKKLDIKSVPTSIIFDDDGNPVSKMIGYDSASYLQWLKKYE
jgi:thioredoxin-like negative regulator of GroEL